MLDNRNIEELSDQAWAKMNDLLDQEMPVQQDSKRPIAFWWFYLAAAVVLIGTIGFLFFRADHRPEQSLAQNQRTAEEAIAREMPEKSGPVLESSTAPAATSSQIITDESANRTLASTTPAFTESGNKSSVNTAISGGPSDPDQMNTILEEEQEERVTAADEMLGKLEVPLPSIDDSVAENRQTAESPVKTVEKENRLNLINLAPISGRPITALEQAPLLLPGSSRYDPKKSLFLRPEINAGITGSLRAGALSGLFAEARSGLKLHNAGKWSFQIGVGLHRQEEPFSVDFRPSGSTEERAAANPGQDQVTNDPLGLNSGSVSITEAVASSEIRLQSTYFDVPLLVDWRFAPRWSVAAGSRLSWLLSTHWKNGRSSNSVQGQAGGNNAVYAFDVSSANRQFSIYQQGSNFTPITFVLQDFYASGTLGITFRPNLKWQLRLQYQHSLTNLLDNPVFRTTDRSLWLSAGLRF